VAELYIGAWAPRLKDNNNMIVSDQPLRRWERGSHPQ